MFSLKTQVRSALFLLPLVSSLSASTPTIGVATAGGKFTLNNASHRSNATLFEGNTFDSGASELEFRLANGTIVQLGASARGTVYSNRITISDGGGDVHAGPGYSVEALSLHIKSTQQGSVARVVVSNGQVKVGALRGELQVSNNKGELVATIAQGEGDAFTPAKGMIEATSVAGIAAGASGAAAAGGVVAAGTAVAGISTGMVVAGVAVVGVGAAAGISVAAGSGNSDLTLSPSVR